MSGRDAFGTQFKRGDGATPTETFTTIAKVTSISGPARTRATIDVTAHDSPNQYMEYIGGLKDGGEVSLEINYDPADTTQDLDGDFDDVTARNYQIVILPDTTDEVTWDFAGWLTELSDEFPHDDKMARTLTVKITGQPVLTETGS